jgi:glycosyltransferase involved in cell wall biosynthesis
MSAIDRLIRAGRFDEAWSELRRPTDGDRPGANGDDLDMLRLQRMTAAMTERFQDAGDAAEKIAARTDASAEDLQHLAQIRLMNLRFRSAFDAAVVAYRADPRLLRAAAVAVVAVAFVPALFERLTDAFGPTSPPSTTVDPQPQCKAAASDRRFSVAVPWRTRVYAPYGGPHPVIASALGPGSTLEARWTPADAPPDPARALPLVPRLAAWADACRNDDERRALAAFLTYRLAATFYPRPNADFTLHHTVPFGVDGLPWAFHIEQLNMLHAPMTAFPKTVIRPNAAWVGILSDIFAAPECLGLVTHIRRTAELLRRLFPRPEIHAKLKHIPLGIDVPARRAAPAARRRVRTLLFTNSLGTDNFFLRGGCEALCAAAKFAHTRNDVRFVFRASPPDMPSTAARARWSRSPNVEWIAQPLSEAEIEELYRESDIFLLPSGLLHAVSIVRALRCGLALVVADAFGVDEFVRHGVNGMIVPGRRALLYPHDEQTLFYEDARVLKEAAPAPVDGRFHRRFVATVERLLDDPSLTARLRRNAARGAARNHDGRRWARELTGWATERLVDHAQTALNPY